MTIFDFEFLTWIERAYMGYAPQGVRKEFYQLCLKAGVSEEAACGFAGSEAILVKGSIVRLYQDWGMGYQEDFMKLINYLRGEYDTIASR